MRRLWLILLISSPILRGADKPPIGSYTLALPEHKGQLRWSADGFEIVQNSAKPNGDEIGVKARNNSNGLWFLGFLFLIPETAPANSSKCRDAALMQDSKGDSSLKLRSKSEIAPQTGPSIALVSYTIARKDGSERYFVRGFVASEDTCGDLEVFSDKPISPDDADVKRLFLSYQLDTGYAPKFADVFQYAQILFRQEKYKAAAAFFEKALNVVPKDGSPFPSGEIAQRVTRDQAGMAFGIGGDLAKARSIFEQGVKEDPGYAMYYYNLACADAGDNNLTNARLHLQQAFARKANTNPGESLPDPTKDDSFLPYRGNQDFWSFLEALKATK